MGFKATCAPAWASPTARNSGCEIELEPSLRANGSRECAPDDRLREAIHLSANRKLDCFVAALLAMTKGSGLQTRRDFAGGLHQGCDQRRHRIALRDDEADAVIDHGIDDRDAAHG